VLNTVNGLRDSGIAVRSISDGIDPATSTGRLMLTMLATLAEYERELIVERVNAGIAASRAAGTRFGRPVSDPAVIEDKLRIVAQARLEFAPGLTILTPGGCAPGPDPMTSTTGTGGEGKSLSAPTTPVVSVSPCASDCSRSEKVSTSPHHDSCSAPPRSCGPCCVR
jgi:hypothetical protein